MLRINRLIFALCMAAFSAGSTLAEKPNIILVITDDQGYGDLGCHGNPVIKTPNLDAFYEDSVRLTDFHVNPTCSPSRGALMCGQFANKAGSWHTINGRNYLRAEKKTIPEVLATGGYKTGMFGKWHLGDNYPYRPHDRGFHHAFYHGGGGIGQTPDYFGNDYNDDTYFLNGKPVEQTGYCTDVWFDHAMKWIEENKDGPFFAYISTNAPHSPFIVDKKYSQMYSGTKGVNMNFFGMITNIDDNFLRLQKKLDELQITDNTILIFTTDNGSAAGANVYNAGMSGKKGSDEEGGHRVPFFIRWPKGGLKDGKDIDQLTAHIDVMPTLLEYAGIQMPKDYEVDGKSLVPLFEGGEWDDSRVIFTDSQRIYTPRKWKDTSVMSGKWRLMSHGKRLYDVSKDPAQKVDVADQFPEVVKRLNDAYDKMWAEMEPGFDKPTHVIVGTEHENPACLTSHDWRGNISVRKVPWHQKHIYQGMRSNSYWEADFATSGTYEISLRRWPQEADLAITAGTNNPKGSAIKVNQAKLEVDDKVLTMPISSEDKAVTFRVELTEGRKRIQSYLLMDGEEVCGAYYCYVKLLE